MADKSVTKSVQQQLPTSDYNDAEIFGSLARANQVLDSLKAGGDSECVLFDIGTFASRERWRLRDLTGVDRRLVDMLQGANITHAFPIQRFSWPQIQRSNFANLIISPEATGKTYAHVLYAISRCIQATPIHVTNGLLDDTDRHQFVPSETIDLEKLIIHPKFIVICSSQDQADMIKRTIEHLKEKAYDIDATDGRRAHLPPVSRTVNIHQDGTKLALRCNESDILIGTPPTILRCLQQDLIHFSKCEKVFFDDLDVVLQLQNNNVRELIKIYLRQIEIVPNQAEGVDEGAKKACRIHMFSRKWTDLVRQFMGSVFTQRNLLFGSLAEAAIHNNLRFDVEAYKDFEQLCKTISHLISILVENSNREKIGIVCRTDEEASKIAQALTDRGHTVKMLREDSTNVHSRATYRSRSTRDLVFVISDPALEFEVEVSNRRKPLDDIMHLIHATLPNDTLTFDQRFRLSFRNIQDKTSGLTSTILIGKKLDVKLAKHIHDLMSRSAATQTASRLVLRDLISNMATNICWRWATTGLCRLEKLSRDDRFGSYCPDRHSFSKGPAQEDDRWPQSGLMRLTITHVVSPSEFYFRFEGHRNYADGRWLKFEESGFEYMSTLQQRLDQVKSNELCSVPLDRIRTGRIFGVYFREEARVDRVRLLGEPKQATDGAAINAALEYSKLVPVVKIDHGLRLEVLVKNLVELPAELANCPAQCHRAFILGYRPTDNEPNWLYKTKRRFHESVVANNNYEWTAWLRANRDHCFWFENLLVSRRLSNIDSAQVCRVQPHRELVDERLADTTASEPVGLKASSRLETLGKWNNDKLEQVAQYAFLRREPSETHQVFLLFVWADFSMFLRHRAYNKQLLDLEQRIADEARAGKLTRQGYLVEGAYCIARIPEGQAHTFNRVKILKILHESNIEEHRAQGPMFRVRCLDHGDYANLAERDLFQASIDHIRLLPFQAIFCKMANVNGDLLADSRLNQRARELITDLTRFENDHYKPVRCRCDDQGNCYLFVQADRPNVLEPLSSLVRGAGIRLHEKPEPAFEAPFQVTAEEDEAEKLEDKPGISLQKIILDLVRSLVVEELRIVGVAAD